jgi:DNA-binding MarR family transcriptional regulator
MEPRPARDDLETIEQSLRSLVRWSRKHSSVLAHELHQGLDLTALAILSYVIEHPRSRISDIADTLRLDLSNASRQSALLERIGLIARSPDPNDRRSALLEPTPEGKEVLRTASSDSRAFMEKVFADWTPEELATLARLLARVVASVDTLHQDLTHPEDGASER